MSTSRSIMTALVASLFLLLPIGASAPARQAGVDEPGAAPGAEEGEARWALRTERADPERLKRVLRVQIERTRTQERDLAEAISMLDAGEAPQDVRAFLQERSPRWRGVVGPGEGPDAEEMLSVLAELNPRLRERLAKARERHPEEFEAQVQRLRPRLGHLMRLREEDPERFELRIEELRLEQRARRLAYTTATLDDEQEVQSTVARLRETVERQFEIRAEFHRREIEDAQERLDRQRARLAQHEADREQLIDERVRSMISQAESDASVHPTPGGPPVERRQRRPASPGSR